ncbi:MAG TPA: hypothetical protein VE398_13670 [Acidobacteriota bacterium]|nr:hypothetical protein [Acidobacteriota bacterium]
MLFKGRLRWTLIFWMFLMSSIAYVDRVNISIAGSAVQRDYGLTNLQLGYGSAHSSSGMPSSRRPVVVSRMSESQVFLKGL